MLARVAGGPTHPVIVLGRKDGAAPRAPEIASSIDELREEAFDKLADLVRNNLDMRKFYEILGAT